MLWHRAQVLEERQTGTDELRKPVTELAETGESVLVRFAPWVPARDEASGNPGEFAERTLVTNAPPSALEGAAALELGGLAWRVLRVSRGGRLTTVRVRRCKDVGNLLPDAQGR